MLINRFQFLVLLCAVSSITVSSAVSLLTDKIPHASPRESVVLKNVARVNWSETMKLGADLVSAGKFAEAYVEFSKAAEAGELIAHHMLGVMQRDGQGTKQDIAQAKKSFTKAASDGDPLASEDLALLSFAAPEGPEEFATSWKELEKFASRGQSRSQLQLGLAHLQGYGFSTDGAKALQYLENSASGKGAGNTRAAAILGNLYLKGNQAPVVKRDPALAELWLKTAAQADDLGSMKALGEFYLNKDFGRQDFVLARHWFENLEKSGQAEGSYFLGLMLENGWGAAADLAKARSYYETGTKGKVPAAFFKMAYFHEKGLAGLPKNRAEAQKFYRQGAERGHIFCMYNLSGLLDGEKEKLPEIKAEVFDLLKRAAAGGLTEAEFKIGARYQKGLGVERDYVAAAAWFDRAARSGHALAQLHLGEMYESGHGLAPDYQSARRLFQLSAANGSTAGQVKYALALANGIGGPQDLAAAYLHAASALKIIPKDHLALTVRNAVEKAMTPEQLQQAKSKLAELEKAAGK